MSKYRIKKNEVEAFKVNELEYEYYIFHEKFISAPEWVYKAVRKIDGLIWFSDELGNKFIVSYDDWIVRLPEGNIMLVDNERFSRIYEEVKG